MREIPLTQGKVALVDNDDYEWLSQWRWCLNTGKGGYLYASRSAKTSGRYITLLMHRDIMKPPQGFVVDHINQKTLDNRRCNLRLATKAQNAWNSEPEANSDGLPYRGVYRAPDGSGYCYRLAHYGKKIRKWGFQSALAAAQARDRKIIELRGAFGRPQFPAPNRRA